MLDFAQDFGLFERVIAAHDAADEAFCLFGGRRPSDGRIQRGLDRLFTAHSAGLYGALFQVDDTAGRIQLNFAGERPFGTGDRRSQAGW